MGNFQHREVCGGDGGLVLWIALEVDHAAGRWLLRGISHLRETTAEGCGSHPEQWGIAPFRSHGEHEEECQRN